MRRSTFDEVYPFEAQRGRESMIGLHLEPAPAPAPPAATPVAPVRAAAAPAPASGLAAGTVFRIGGLALAAAGVALGAGLLVEASARGDEASALAAEIRGRGGPAACLYHEHAAACGGLGDSHRARDTLKAAAWASFASAGVVGAVALSSFWWAPAPGTRAVRLVPLATAQGGGVLIVGAW
ncbi:hypothetical protein WMF18_26115 [Sorangium sp. So ce315]|uniref:hypothetical protein n=1 Tax=Sorangium sp. So ce315 TaxID=3133299 RepID=UPI003F600E08